MSLFIERISRCWLAPYRDGDAGGVVKGARGVNGGVEGGAIVDVAGVAGSIIIPPPCGLLEVV